MADVDLQTSWSCILTNSGQLKQMSCLENVTAQKMKEINNKKMQEQLKIGTLILLYPDLAIGNWIYFILSFNLQMWVS